MLNVPAKLNTPRKVGYILVGIMAFGVLALSIVQPFVFSGADVPAYGSIQPDGRGLPADDKRGAFLVLNESHNPAYPGTLLELLATTEAGVVDEKAGAHLLPGEIKAVLIQTAALSENRDYRVYRFNVDEGQQMKYRREPSGKLMYVETANGRWEPGTYIVDIPSEGMFGGRTYYQFYVDATRVGTPAK